MRGRPRPQGPPFGVLPPLYFCKNRNWRDLGISRLPASIAIGYEMHRVKTQCDKWASLSRGWGGGMTQWLADNLCPHLACWSLKAQLRWPQVALPVAGALLPFPILLTCGPLLPPQVPNSLGLAGPPKQRWSQVVPYPRPFQGLFWG